MKKCFAIGLSAATIALNSQPFLKGKGKKERTYFIFRTFSSFFNYFFSILPQKLFKLFSKTSSQNPTPFRDEGRTTIQQRAIMWPHRIQGTTPRVKITREIVQRTLMRVKALKTTALITIQPMKVDMFSPMKIRVYPTPSYSTVYPVTSSHSPLAKSKGLRCLSIIKERIILTTTQGGI